MLSMESIFVINVYSVWSQQQYQYTKLCVYFFTHTIVIKCVSLVCTGGQPGADSRKARSATDLRPYTLYKSML